MIADSASSQAVAGSASPVIRRLQLTDFRSYARLDINVDRPLIVLTGDNGAGKTNILEAISLLSPGRGLRGADNSEYARAGGSGGFAISALIASRHGPARLGTGIDTPVMGVGRRHRVNGENAPSARLFAEHLRLIWLTPAMDRLFAGPAGDRRRFLDRLVLAVDAEHGTRAGALERALRNRNRLLEMESASSAWLDAAEREIAELAIAVAYARGETVTRLANLIAQTRNEQSPFPWASLSIVGDIDQMVRELPAIEAEDAFRGMLRANRRKDAAAGRALCGPQASDLKVLHGPKMMPAALSSPGEQKALLTGLMLAHSRLVASMWGTMPILLLDEIAAHFDPSRREALFQELLALGAQVWMTGADPELFSSIADLCDQVRIEPNRATVNAGRRQCPSDAHDGRAENRTGPAS